MVELKLRTSWIMMDQKAGANSIMVELKSSWITVELKAGSS